MRERANPPTVLGDWIVMGQMMVRDVSFRISDIESATRQLETHQETNPINL